MKGDLLKMTNKEKTEVLSELYAYLCGEPGKEAPEYTKMRKAMQSAISSAISAAPSGEPLTLDQLREMDGQPVWIEDIRDRKWFNPGWAIVDVSNRLVREAKNWNPVFLGDYGEQWLAYAHPPAHIDREAWVSAEERLPNEGENVLVFAKAKYANGCKFVIDRLEKGERKPIWMYTHGWFEVTHWMPLPNPPSDLEDQIGGAK